MPVVAKILRARSPLRRAHLIEFGQQEFAQIARRNDVSKEQADHLPPHDMLAAETIVPITGGNIDIGLANHEFITQIATHGRGVDVVFHIRGGIRVNTRRQLPLDAVAQAPFGSQIAACAKFRPMRRAVVGPRRGKFDKTKEWRLVRGHRLGDIKQAIQIIRGIGANRDGAQCQTKAKTPQLHSHLLKSLDLLRRRPGGPAQRAIHRPCANPVP